MKIIVDAFGGDHAPLEVIRGCADAVQELNCEVLLCGKADVIRHVATQHQIPLRGIQMIDAPDVISMEDDPAEIVKSKKQCSMAEGLRRLTAGEGAAFVSAGSTGALVMGSTFLVKRIRGVKRCALAPLIPTTSGQPCMLLDVGANADCRPEMLLQFGIMGSVYLEKVLGVKSPRVGLVNIGAEPTKGGKLQLDTFDLLKEAPVNFAGNIEARDIPYGVCDVLVADGFTGNVVLKLLEGSATALFDQIKGVLSGSLRAKAGAALILPGLKTLKKRLSTEEYGGAPLLGAAHPVFKAHGNAKARAIRNAIAASIAFAEGHVIERIAENLPAVEK